MFKETSIRIVKTSNTVRQQMRKVCEEAKELAEAECKSRKNDAATRVKAAEEAVDVLVATMTYLDLLIKELNASGLDITVDDVIELVNHKNQVRGRFNDTPVRADRDI